RAHPDRARVQLAESRDGGAGHLLRAAHGGAAAAATGGPHERRAARDGGRSRGLARAPRTPADRVRFSASRAPAASQAQAAAHLSQSDARSERACDLARHVDVARAGAPFPADVVMSADEIYLDYAATSPVDPAVGAAMIDCLTHEHG